MSKKASFKSKPEFRYVPRSRDLPAAQGMLQLVRTELKSEMKAGFSRVDSRFSEMNSKFEQVLSEVARVGVLVEEQNSRNQIVLEGLTGLWQRQDRVETRMDDLEKFVRSIARAKS